MVVFIPIVFDNNSSQAASSVGKETLTMITSPDYPPYELYDTRDGKRQIVGFDIDIANYIASELGFTLKIAEADFNGLIPALQANRADFVMAGMTPTPQRRENVDFSIVYYEAKDTIVSPKDSNITQPEDLSGKKVGVQLGTIQEENAKKIAVKVPGVQIKRLNRVPQIIQEIQSRRIDAAIIEDNVARGSIQVNPNLQLHVIPSVEGASGSAIAFPKGSPLVEPFNKVLQKMKDSGELEKLAKKWFAQSVTKDVTYWILLGQLHKRKSGLLKA